MTIMMTKNLEWVGQRHRYYPRLHGSQAVNLIIIIVVIIIIIIVVIISININFVTIFTFVIIIDSAMEL